MENLLFSAIFFVTSFYLFLYTGGMDVYVEYVLIDNFIIDLLILYLVARTLHLRTNKWKIILSSVIGTIFALISPLLQLPSLLLVFTKFLLALLMVLVLGAKNIKQYLMSLLFFISYTFLLGGACLGVLFMMKAEISSLTSLNYFSSVPVGLVVLIVWIYVRIIFEVSSYIYRKKEVSSFLYNVKIENDGQQFDITGFLDSGNRLFDEKYALSVVVVSEHLFYKIFPKLKTGGSREYQTHFLPYSTVSGNNSQMLVAIPEKFYVILSDGEVKLEKKVVIGMSRVKLEKQYDCLLNAFIM